MLQYDEAQIETLKTTGKALDVLNKTLHAAARPDTKVKVFTVRLNKELADFLLKFTFTTNHSTSSKTTSW